MCVCVCIKHQLFLTAFNRYSNHMTSIIVLLFSNKIGNIICAAYLMNLFIIELISKVSIVISSALDFTSYHSP